LTAFPSSVIITIDDDCLYHFDLIENLVNAYRKNPKMIYCTRMHRMKFINRSKLDKYKKWIWNYEDFDTSPLNFPTGVGGVLYPPNCFNNEVFNENVFLDICKYADDVWFKAMALLNNTSSQRIFIHNKGDGDLIPTVNIEDTQLSNINIAKSLNDIQLKAVFSKYNLYKRLITINS